MIFNNFMIRVRIFLFLKVLWLPPGKREYVKKNAPGFIQVYKDTDMLMENNGSYLNVKYSKLKMEEIR